MNKVVHARLNRETTELLARLRRETGLTDSELVRRGLMTLASVAVPRKGHMPIGTGQFASGVPDLGSNKAHLAGFGE